MAQQAKDEVFKFAGNFSATSRNIRLDGTVLLCQAQKRDQSWVDSSIDLNNIIGNNNGSFAYPGDKYSETARDVVLNGVTLTGNLQKRDQTWTKASVNLDVFITNNNGKLEGITGNDKPEEKSNSGKLLMTPWEPCSDDILKAAMEGVKDEFFKVAKELGFDSKDKAYCPTDSGIYLGLPIDVFNGEIVYIGLVRLAKKGTIGGYWASIRSSHLAESDAKGYALTGFSISPFGMLSFVDNDVYKFGDLVREYPKDWKPCVGDTLKQCKHVMEKIKSKFEEDYNKPLQWTQIPKPQYHPLDSGICKLLSEGAPDGYSHYIGLVQLSKPGTIGGYYASIRVSEFSSNTLVLPNPFTLEGYIISDKPWLQFVRKGQNITRIGFLGDKGLAVNALANNNNNGGSDDEKKQMAALSIGSMDYLPTGSIQSTMESFKDKIKEKCGIVGDLDTFQVVSATACCPYNINLWSYFVKIYIGIDDTTNFTSFIYVKYFVSLYGFGSTYLESAQLFPF